MASTTTEAIRLYGTAQAVEPMVRLVAGPVTCEFDQGALRFIKIHGKEAIRNIAFVVRDKDWGTCAPILSNVIIDQQDDSFTLSFDAICKNDDQQLSYRATITGDDDGSLLFTGDYISETGFVTNRTGFVVLHPISGVAGQPVTVEHTDGKSVQAVFPELVDPIQPFKNIRALTHKVLPGISVCCRMTGDAFEMEDHRQWNDASFKTYVRPLELPWPYTIVASELRQQTVSLTLSGNVNRNTDKPTIQLADQQPKHCLISISKADNPTPMPQIGLGLEPQHLDGALACQDLLKQLAPQQLVLWHELGKHSGDHFKLVAQLANNINTNIELQAVIPDNDFTAEIAELATQCRNASLTLTSINVAPAMYLNSIMPGPSWPNVTALADIYDEVRRRFADVKVGGGMLSFFPELNRHRPPVEHLDFVSHASNTITHACDDITATENLEAIPFIINTCRSFAGDKPYHVGPSSIGMRFNPYGSKTMDNPDNNRIAMARMDPRQRGLVNAAWTIGYAAHMARGAIDAINLHAVTGEFGVINYPQDWPQPEFDNANKQVYPAYHTVAGLAKAAGKPQLLTHSTMSREVEVFAYGDAGQSIVWIANLTSDIRRVEIIGLGSGEAKLASLSLESFDHCTQHCNGFDQTSVLAQLPLLDLGPYSVVRLTTSIY